ncbi:MAG: hypothetical protein NVSMB62_03170 [Acidobacteriaceae bacterium]
MSVRPAAPALIVAAMLVAAPNAHAQGCAQCRDNTAATLPSTQRAYVHAIEFMSAAATMLFAGVLIVFKRHP